jgi:hypothetical protein
MMLTPEQIELVAREWCRLSNVDPDEFQPEPARMNASKIMTMEQRMVPAWKIIAGHVMRHALMQEAFMVLMPQVAE